MSFVVKNERHQSFQERVREGDTYEVALQRIYDGAPNEWMKIAQVSMTSVVMILLPYFVNG